MSPYLKWPIAALTLIGSIVGAGLTLATLLGVLTKGPGVGTLPIFLAVATLYSLGLAAGVRFAQDDARRGLLRVYYLLQILWITSPFVSFRFVSGAHIMPGVMGEKISFSWGLGSVWHVAASSAASWGLGINLVALAVLWLLRSPKKKRLRKR